MKVDVLIINSKISFIAVILLTVSFLSAMAQTPSGTVPITVTTDKSSYSDGDKITISGTVTDQLNVPISIVIKDSSKHVVLIGQISPGADNTYSTQVTAGGSLWTSTGQYEIDVTYASKDRTANTTFQFTSTPATATNGTTGNVIPEFGIIAPIILAIAMFSVLFYTKSRKISEL